MVALAGGGLAGAGPATPAEIAARRRQALSDDADALRRLARWAEENGLERTAEADWERALALDPDDAATRKRLRWLRPEKDWVRDLASWTLVRAPRDTKPDRRAAYDARRLAEYFQPSAARHRTLAANLRAAGAGADADAEVQLALERDPDDVWCHLARGEVPDPVLGWVAADVRLRRIAEARTEAAVHRLQALGALPVREVEPGPHSAAAGTPLALWRLREWVLESDLDDEAAVLTLATVDLGARWFRERFEIEQGARVLPGEGRFVILSTPALYAAVVEAQPRLSPPLRAFAKSLSAMPVPAEGTGESLVLAERPDGLFAADVALHYGLHFLLQARYHVEPDAAWLYEGFAAYGTLRLLGTQASWCIALEETSAAYGGRAPSAETWGAQAVEAIRAGKDEPLRRMVGASLNELDGPMLVKGWALLRWMLEEHPDEALAMFEAHRAGLDAGKALERATGMRLDDIDAAWRLHLVATEPD
jgi:hypothetical protein